MRISPWQYFFLISLLLFVIHVVQARVAAHYTTDVIHTSRDQHVRSEAQRSLLHAVYKVLIRLAQGARPRLRGWNKHQAERAIWCCGASSAHCVCGTQCCRPYVCTTVGWMTHYGLNAKIIFSLISLHQWERGKKNNPGTVLMKPIFILQTGNIFICHIATAYTMFLLAW